MECVTCVCVGSGRGRRCWGEWVRVLDMGFSNPGRTWGK